MTCALGVRSGSMMWEAHHLTTGACWSRAYTQASTVLLWYSGYDCTVKHETWGSIQLSIMMHGKD
jgi:hypothetical protein